MDDYLAGDPRAAVDGIFSEVSGLDWRAEVSRTVPGGPEQADQDAATLFESDLRAGQQLHFGVGEAAKITQPVLFLTGTDSLPIFRGPRPASRLPTANRGRRDARSQPSAPPPTPC
jgi:hypothetical protein